MRVFRVLGGTAVLALLVCIVSSREVSLRTSSVFALRRAKEAVSKIASVPSLRNIAKETVVALPKARAALESKISTSFVSKVESVAKAAESAFDRALIEERKVSKSERQNAPIGPHLLVNPIAQRIARTGIAFQEASIQAAKGLKLGRSGGSQLKTLRKFKGRVSGCEFTKPISCKTTAKYRTADGSCNNLAKPIWGRANTPFGRFLPPQYGDGISSPRDESVFSLPLPNARELSLSIHSKSTVADLHPSLAHSVMEFGQFISHDVNRNTLSAGYGGGSLSCCKSDGTVDASPFKTRLGCLPIQLPANDPFFSPHGKRCMNFVRASPTPDIDCDIGLRQQLNQVTHYIDASTVYGSDEATMKSLRTNSKGLMKVTNHANGPLLPQNAAATGTPGCRTSGANHCFKAGDVRSNQQPGLMTMHTIFVREHNRVATKLAGANPHWNDETLFQEARKIVIAEIQHVTYTEYLRTVFGDTFADRFGFAPQPTGSYFTGYDASFDPSIRNSFAAAAYRFGHSTVRDDVAPGKEFKDHFLNPALMYQSAKGPTFLAKSLVEDRQQKTDNLMTTQLTNHLFERTAGTGIDLAATNIQRGRDHGIANYNLWRLWCGLEYAQDFTTGTGGLVDHEPDVAALLEAAYETPDDIDLWTGVVTETPLEGRALGPTGACIVARQFWVLKHADRFYYETDNANVKFDIEQLDEIRKTSLATIICDNTDLTDIAADAFQEPSSDNPKVSCKSLSGIDFSKWRTCVDRKWGPWSSYSRCVGGSQIRRRKCLPAPPNTCANNCSGRPVELRSCGGGGPDFPFRIPNFPKLGGPSRRGPSRRVPSRRVPRLERLAFQK